MLKNLCTVLEFANMQWDVTHGNYRVSRNIRGHKATIYRKRDLIGLGCIVVHVGLFGGRKSHTGDLNTVTVSSSAMGQNQLKTL